MPPGRHDCARLVPGGGRGDLTERPWNTKTTGPAMRVHRKVSQQRRANRVSGHRLEAGQMRGKGQPGDRVPLPGSSEGFRELVFQLSVTL